jgi:hypothetical protein
MNAPLAFTDLSQTHGQRTATQRIYVEQSTVPERVVEQFNVPARVEQFGVPVEHRHVPEESLVVPRTKTQLRNFFRRRKKYFQGLSTPIQRPLTHVVGDSPNLRREEASPSFSAARAEFTTQLTTRSVAQSATNSKQTPPTNSTQIPTTISTRTPPTTPTLSTRATSTITPREEASFRSSEQSRDVNSASLTNSLTNSDLLPPWKARRLERLMSWESRRRVALRKEQEQFRQRLHQFRLQFLRMNLAKPARIHTTHAQAEMPKRRWEPRPAPSSSPTLASLDRTAVVYVELNSTQNCSTVDTSMADPAEPTISIIECGLAPSEWEFSPSYTSPGYTSEGSPAGDPPAGLPIVSNISTAQQDPDGDSWDEATELAVGHYEVLKPVEQASRRSRFLRSEEKPPPPSRRDLRRATRAQLTIAEAATTSTIEDPVNGPTTTTAGVSLTTAVVFASAETDYSFSLPTPVHAPAHCSVSATSMSSTLSTSTTATHVDCDFTSVDITDKERETDRKRKRKKKTHRTPPACPTDADLLDAFREWQAIYSGVAEILEEDYPPLVVQHYDYWAEQGLGYICIARADREELLSCIRPRAIT